MILNCVKELDGIAVIYTVVISQQPVRLLDLQYPFYDVILRFMQRDKCSVDASQV